MKKPAQKARLSYPEVDFHQAAQLSALRALSLSFPSGISSASFREFSENFLEYVLQIFLADGAYLEFSSQFSSKKLRLAIGSCRATERKMLFSKVTEQALIPHAQSHFGSEALKRAGWNPNTASLLFTPIHFEDSVHGVLALGKSGTPSFFKQTDIEEIALFTHYLALVSKIVSTKKTREEILQDFSENLEDGVFVIDRNGRPVVVNPKGLKLLGVPDKESAIHAFYDDPVLLDVRSRDNVPLQPRQLPLARVLRGETFSSVECVIRRPTDETDVHLALSGAFLYNKNEKIVEGVLLVREVTEAGHRERRLRKELFDQKEKQEIQTAFFNHVSHELKTPINAIMGYTSLMLKGSYGRLSEKVKGPLLRTHDNAKELTRMINDLLTLAKIEAEKITLSAAPVDLEILVRDMILDSHSLLDGKPVELAVKIDPELPSIRTDPDKLREVFINLFSNAVKYTFKGSIQIIVKNLPEQKRVRVDLVDTGIGIPAEDLPHLFEEFQRGEDPMLKNISGTGLGLSIVKKMTHLLQGSVEVKSVYGRGSTFTVLLPYTLRTDS